MMMTALSIFLYVSKPIVIIFGRIFPAINQLFKVPKVSQGFDSPPITKRHLEGLGKSDWWKDWWMVGDLLFKEYPLVI